MISEGHVKLKTGVIAAENSTLNGTSKYIKIENSYF